MKTQILTALLVLAMMMGTGTVMAEDHTAPDDGEYLGEDFGNYIYSPSKGEIAPVSHSPNPYITNPLCEDFGYHHAYDDVAEVEV
ncbi:MAG: hypothetical protein C5S43_00890 [Candidatus Methanocomedens sp.]|nr:MAG: hypothetical protein C5S43_00890 [ANME-2 cluster archaeon]